MKLIAAFFLISAIVTHAAPPATTGRVARTWTSSDGKTLQAELLEYSASEVKIKRSADFQIMKIPLDRLGEADRKMILDMLHKDALDTGLTKGPYAEQIKGQFVQGKSKQGLNYQLYGNPAWDGTRRYPLVIWLHGSGQSGSDNTSQMGGATGVFTKATNQELRPCLLLAPQCPDSAVGWRNEVAQNLMALIADLTDKLPIDQSRIYLTGSSMGGSGTWGIIAKWPNVFACGVVLCGGGDPKTAETIKHVPIWVFHGDKDDMVPVDRARNMYAALKAVNGKTQYSELTGEGHNIAGVVYAKPELHQWMFEQRLSTESAPAATSTASAVRRKAEMGKQNAEMKLRVANRSAIGLGTCFYFCLLLAAFCFSQSADGFEKWFKEHTWKRDSETPLLSLGEKGKFDDQHIFAPHVIFENGEYWMYYSGSQRCVDAGTYKGVAKDPAQPEKSDQRLFKLGLAKSKDGVHFTRHSTEPVFSFGDDIHSVVTAAILKNPDGLVCREDGKLRMYFAAVDFPNGKYKHDLYETRSVDGINWEKPTHVMANMYAPCVIKENGKYRMWYTWIDRHPWHTRHAESEDGTKWRITEKPCIVMDQPWEKKDQVYPMVIKADDVYIMLYGCYWEDDKHTALGFAVSRDGLDWTKHPNNPVFRPEPKHDWESNFTTSQSLMRLPDGSFRLWYAGRRQPPWSNLYFAIGTASWEGPGK